MEVILKKTKITSSILNQTLLSTEYDLDKGEILGWCLYKGYKYMVCYRSDIQKLTKHPVIKEIKTQNIPDGHSCVTIIYFQGSYGHNFQTEAEKDEYIKIFTQAKIKAETKGQFFI